MAVSVTRLHPFDHATARKRVDVLAETLSRKLNLRTSWEGNRLSFRRTGAKGHIDVTPDHIHVEIRTSPLLPLSDDRLRRQVNAVLDEHIPPMPAPAEGPSDAMAPEAERPRPPEEDPAHRARTSPPPDASSSEPSSTATEDTGARADPTADDAAEGTAGPLGALTSGLLGAAFQTSSASLKAARDLLLAPEQLDALPDDQRERLEAIGKQLRQFRTEAGLTTEEVSQRLGIDASMLHAIERGTARLSLPLLHRLTTILPTIPSGWIDRFTPPQPPDASPTDD
jgi:putative polyhydroxyalkanoate system protein